jgi:hypothetical protein
MLSTSATSPNPAYSDGLCILLCRQDNPASGGLANPCPVTCCKPTTTSSSMFIRRPS